MNIIPEKIKTTIKLDKKQWKMIGAGVVVFLLMIIIIAINAVETYNDGKLAKSRRISLVTRFPQNSYDFFEGNIPKSKIYLSWYDNTINIGDKTSKTELNAVIYPVTLQDRTLSYKTSDERVATVKDGKIEAKAPGNVEITVSNDYTGEKSKAYLQVVQPVTGFYLQKSTINLYLTDESVSLTGEISPENASNTAVQWYSKDTNIVQVDQTGHLKPVATGMTEVVAKTTDGGFTGKCFVNVINEVIKAEKVTIQNKDIKELAAGESYRCIASVLPANAKNKTIVWESSNEKVAEVNQAGRIKALSAGRATITAKSADGPTDSFEIAVTGRIQDNSTGISINTHTFASGGGVSYTAYDTTLDSIASLQMRLSPPPKSSSGSGYADIDEVTSYMDPNKYCMGAYKYQFMDLSQPNGLSAEELNEYLADKGVLRGMGAAFIQAANTYGLSEIYLVAHACHETGNGTSRLSTGVEVDGVTVYNMYGIAAFDNSALSSGTQKALKEGWTTPEAAIIGGAKWISDYYVNSSSCRQNTLYKMRWNPESPGQHLYATDAGWAVKQAVIVERIVRKFPNASMSYEIPVYMGANAAIIEE